jgi:predicted DNA-binding transcriptional regulator AlpA
MRPKQAAQYIGLSIATFWRIVKEDDSFPQPFKLAANSSAVMRADLDAWLESRRGVL